MAERKRILVDSGAIVAAIDRRDQWHQLAEARFRITPKPFYTCDAALSETCFLLGESKTAFDSLWGLIADGVIVLDFSLAEHLSSVGALMKKYRNVPMSLADACLVRMSELASDALLFTYDSDFSIYRRHGKQMIPIVG